MLYDTDGVHGSPCTCSVKLSRAYGCLGQKIPGIIGACEFRENQAFPLLPFRKPRDEASTNETIRVPAIADCVHDEDMDACTRVMNTWMTYQYIHTYTYMT